MSTNHHPIILGVLLGFRYFLRSRDRNVYIILGITLVQVLFLVVTASSLNFTKEVTDLYSPLHDKLVVMEKGTVFLEGLPMSSFIDISVYEELKSDALVGETIAVYYERSGSSLQSNILVGVSQGKHLDTNPFVYALGIHLSKGNFPRFVAREVIIGSETTYAKEKIGVGDIISIGDQKNLTITGFFDMNHFLKDRFVVMPLPLLQNITGLFTRINMIVVEPRKGVALKELEQYLEQKYHKLTVLNEQERKELVNDVLGTVNNFTIMIAAVSLMAGTILIISLTNIVLINRIRDLGILKSLGITNTMMFVSILTENSCIQFISYLFGVLLSFIILSFWTSFSLRELKISRILTIDALLISLLVLLMMTVLGTFLGGRKILKMTIVEMMNY